MIVAIVCNATNLHTELAMLRHLTHHPNSLHSGEPQLLRVVLTSLDETEAILLRDSSCGVRVLPDLPWGKRQRGRSEGVGHPNRDYNRTVFVHGIPELLAASGDESEAHDRE